MDLRVQGFFPKYSAVTNTVADEGVSSTTPQPSSPWVSRVIWYNRLASILHLSVLVFVVYVCFGTGEKEYPVWHVKQDALHFRPSAAGPSNLYNRAPASSQVCNVVPANVFPVGDMSFSMTTYPKTTGLDVYLHVLVIVFFSLSFFFQGIVVESMYRIWPFFPKSDPKHFYHLMFDQDGSDVINFMRYIEYSMSASVMLVALSLLAGITDLEVLTYTALLCAVCMLVGWCAEVVFNVGKTLHSQPGAAAAATATLCKRVAWGLHIIGWLCIVPPYCYILYHYGQLFQVDPGECKASNSSAGSDVPTPPPWLQFVFFGQAFLFFLFGLVQTIQFGYGYPSSSDGVVPCCKMPTRVLVECLYIFLSLFAKFSLGITVSATLFMP